MTHGKRGDRALGLHGDASRPGGGNAWTADDESGGPGSRCFDGEVADYQPSLWLLT